MRERMISVEYLEIVLAKKFRTKSIQYDDLLAAIANMPTVDAVNVVYCKDCNKWLKCEPSGTNCRVCVDTTKIRLPYDFCSYGERRDDV